MLRIDLAAATPAYEQIANGLRALLVAETMAPGEQLPTVRQLALDLGVHHNTVAEAYRQLAAEGWLDLRRGHGATVLERPTPEPSPEAAADFARRFEELVAKAIAAGVPRERIAAELAEGARRLRKGVEP
jgi:DNA-binding transcriptional regulator YhcF (GntR family)